MPCRHDDMIESEAEKKNKDLEVLLCSACKELESTNYDFGKNPSLDKWWHNHKEEDAKRLLRDKEKELQQAQAKQIMEKPLKDITHQEKTFLRSVGFRIF